MNSNCSCPRAVRAASVIVVVGLALMMAPSAHANGMSRLSDDLERAAELVKSPWFIVAICVACVVGVLLVVLLAWGVRRVLQTASQSSRPRENIWAAWSLILGVGSLLCLQLAGPFAIWTGIKSYRMGGSKGMAVWGIVLGAVGTLCGAVLLFEVARALLFGAR